MSTPGPEVVAVVPGDVDDPRRPSGGNTYDRRVVAELRARGWRVAWRPVSGAWPHPDAAALDRLAATLRDVPPAATALVDGLVASAAPAVLAATSPRVVVVVHLPLGTVGDAERGREGPALRAAHAVVATSRWSAGWLEAAYGLRDVHVARPGVDPAPVTVGSRDGGRLLCVASVVPGKGHEVLVEALAGVADLPWECTCVGSLDRAPDAVDRTRRRIERARLGSRVRLVGPLPAHGVAAAYAGADLLVLPSRAETWGMVVTEAVARGVPVLASGVGGVPEALGVTVDGAVPGLLVPPDQPGALARALRRWLTEDAVRARLRAAAVGRRTSLEGWGATADRLATALTVVAA